MDRLRVKFRLESLSERDRAIETSLPIDSASPCTWVFRSKLEQAGLAREKKRRVFRTADSHEMERSMGFVVVRVDDRETVDEVVFAEPEDRKRVGYRTLTGLGLTLDQDRGVLVPADPSPVAIA